MRGYGYEPGPGWVPDRKQDRQETGASMVENSPQTVLGQIALILIVALGLAFVVNLVLFNFNIG